MRHSGRQSRSLAGLLLALATLAGFVYQSPNSSGKENRARLNPAAAGATIHSLNAAAQMKAVRAYSKLPLAFEANQGQADPSVKYLARTGGTTLILKPAEAMLAIGPNSSQTMDENGSGELNIVRMRLLGANASPRMEGLDKLPGESNYFQGSDPKKWETHVSQYGKVAHRNVYPGVDFIFYGNQGRFEYDVVVAPGADLRNIQLGFEGIGRLRLDGNGDLLLGLPNGEIRQLKPKAYQMINGAERSVEAAYELKENNTAAFKIGAYDSGKPLIIDPILTYGSFFGGSGYDEGRAITVDAAGNAYFVGRTNSNDLPMKPGAYQSSKAGGYDAYVAKLDPTGSMLLYSTYIGGGSNDYGHGIAVDAAGNAYITGDASSSNFPVTSGVFQSVQSGAWDAFVTKLNASGSALVYSSYIGGGDVDYGRSIGLDASGNAFITGYTYSSNFPIANALQASSGGVEDAFVVKVNASATGLLYSTYLGGGSSDYGYAIAADTAGNAYVAGMARSTNFPITPGAYKTSVNSGDVFVTKLNPAGSAKIYSTFLGGGSDETGFGIAVDSTGNAYVAGSTSSWDFPITPGAPQRSLADPSGGAADAFVTKLNTLGNALIYSTYLGGSSGDQANAIAVDPIGNAWIAGHTYSANFPVVNPFINNNKEGNYGIFQSADGANSWTQSAGMPAFDVSSIAIDPSNSLILYASTVGGGIYKSADGGGNWYKASSSAGWTNFNTVAIDPHATGVIYAGASCTGVFKSTNNGLTWTKMNTGPANGCVHSLALNPAVSTTIYAGTSGGVFKTTDGGNAWIASNTGIAAGKVVAVAIDPAAPAILYAAVNGAGMFKSADSGGTWSAINNGLTNYSLNQIVIDPGNPAKLYCSTSGAHVFKSTDSGATWVRQMNGIVDSNILSLAIDWNNTDTLYAGGAGSGVYKTTNGGNNWNSFSNLPPFSPVRSLAVDPFNSQKLYAGLNNNADIFITELDPTGMTVLASTYLGSLGWDYGDGLAVDSSANVYLTGVLDGSRMRGGYALPGAFQVIPSGGSEAFVIKIAEPPSFDITLNQPAYINGDMVMAHEFRLRNLSIAAVLSELKVWLGVPGQAPITILNIGYDGAFSFPAMINYNIGPLNLFTVSPSLPRGEYELSSRIVEPSTVKLVNECIRTFTIQ